MTEEKKPNIMLDMLKMGILLMVVTAISAALLAYVYTITSPIIEETRSEQINQYLRQCFPQARFTDSSCENMFIAEGKDVIFGYALLGSSYGYSSDVVSLACFNPRRQVVDVFVLEQQETPGIGSKITLPDFLSRFKGLVVSEVKVADGITRATRSSNAFKKGIYEASIEAQGCIDELLTDVELEDADIIKTDKNESANRTKG